MRLLWFPAAFTLTACATGAPVDGRHVRDRYEPFSRGFPSQGIPHQGDGRLAATSSLAPRARATAVASALGLLGKNRVVVGGKRYGDDCTGFVKAIYEPLGIDLSAEGKQGDNGVTAMWRFATHHGRIFEGGRPVPGDLVFFKETYDLNRDGRSNDGLTHVGLVEDVETDGTVLIIHRVARGVVRYRMNLAHPSLLTTADGKRLNDWLRTEAPGSRPRLTAELFAAYATVLPVESSLAGR